MLVEPEFVQAVEALIRELRRHREEAPELFNESHAELLARLESAIATYRKNVAARDRTGSVLPDEAD